MYCSKQVYGHSRVHIGAAVLYRYFNDPDDHTLGLATARVMHVQSDDRIDAIVFAAEENEVRLSIRYSEDPADVHTWRWPLPVTNDDGVLDDSPLRPSEEAALVSRCWVKIDETRWHGADTDDIFKVIHADCAGRLYLRDLITRWASSALSARR